MKPAVGSAMQSAMQSVTQSAMPVFLRAMSK